MEPLNKVRLNTALDSRSVMPISSTHVTSSNFMLLRPFFYRHTTPTEDGVANGSVTTILDPLAVPTYGRARINLRSFFIPYRLLYHRWDALINDTEEFHSNTLASIPQTVPYFTTDDICDMLTAHNCIVAVTSQTAIQSGIYDFTDGTNYSKFSMIGQLYMTLFESLGYRWNYDSKKQKTAIIYNALNLLAFVKVWLDWYVNSQYMDASIVDTLQSLLMRAGESDSYRLTATELHDILNAVLVVGYDSNSYFISAWDSPTAPNPGNTSQYSINDTTMSNQSGFIYPQSHIGNGSSVTTPYISGIQQDGVTAASSPYRLTQFSIDALKSLTDYIRRNQMSSARAIDRYLARFGVQLKGESVKRSVYCGYKSVDIDFSSVVATADTSSTNSPSNLGDRAGKGDGHGVFSFEYDTQGEYGIFMILSSIIPDAGMFEGYDRNNRMLSRLDFWTPEFDQLGVQAVEKGEVVVFTDTQKIGNDKYDNTFGFVPSYAHYKVGRDFFTGMLRYKSLHLGGSSYHLFREMQDVFANLGNTVHGFSFTYGRDRDQYNRIFTYNGANNDLYEHFTMVYHTELNVKSPMKSLFDTYEFKNKGDEVTLDANGVKVN